MNFKQNGAVLRCCNRNDDGKNLVDVPGETKLFHYVWGGGLPDESWVVSDLDNLCDELSISDREADRLYSDLLSTLDSISSGLLIYSDSYPRDVCQVRDHDQLLEIRLPKPRKKRKKLGAPYWGRLYVHEPDEQFFAGVVCLFFHLKQSDNEDLNKRQGEYMQEAAMRIPKWERQRSKLTAR